MTPGLSHDLDQIEDVRKTKVLNDELLRLGVDNSALQETRLAGSGSLCENDYTTGQSHIIQDNADSTHTIRISIL